MELQNEFILVGATLIDGNGGPPQEGTIITVKDGVIHNITSDRSVLKLKPDVQKLDFTGNFVMPGLIDSHIHFAGDINVDPINWISQPQSLKAIRTVAEAQNLLDFGFTTVRSCGSRYDIHLKRAIEEGTIIGPRIVACGRGLCRTGGHGDIRRDLYDLSDDLVDKTIPWALRCDGVEEIRKAVRKLISQGVDAIKVWMCGGGSWERDSVADVHFTMEELNTVVEEARMAHLRVAAHCENLATIKMAIAAGVDTIEHADVLAGEEKLDEDTCRAMVKQDIIIVPTLSIYFVGPWAVEAIPQNIVDSYKLAIKTGVKIAAGADNIAAAVTPYGQFNLGEIKLLVDILGLTPMQAIVSATKIGAEALGIADKVGTVEKGKSADLLIIKGNPAENISVLMNKENIEHVIKEGKLIR